MKYLKSYTLFERVSNKTKLFEANWYDMKDHIKVLSDMSLPLWDKEFNIQVSDQTISKSDFNESFGQNDEPIKVLNDICLELSDEDYSFFIQDLKGTGVINPDRISVSVAGKPNEGDEWRYRAFTYDDVRDVFERMIEYMDSEDFEILRFVYSTPENPADHNFLEYQNGQLMTYNREKVDRFHHLQINFVKKEVKTNESTEEDVHRELMIKKYGIEEIEECDEVIGNIKDMALEVEDLGITVLVGYSPMTYMSAESTPKISISVISDARLFAGNIADIDIFTDTLLSYVKSLGFSTGKNTFITNGKMTRQILIQK